MKTIVVLSDTHGNRAVFDKLKRVLSECDYIFHLGDTSSDGAVLKKQYPRKTRLLNGNCDFFPTGEREICEQIEGVKILACHGDAYSVKRGLDNLIERAKALGCTLALYGHTHEADERTIDGVTAVNPGALTRYGKNSYAYVVINGGKAVCKIVEL